MEIKTKNYHIFAESYRLLCLMCVNLTIIATVVLFVRRASQAHNELL
jgi:hypothetical protein